MVRCVSPCVSVPVGQDQCSKPQQCGWGVLHLDWRAGAGYARGLGRVLLQVQDWVQEDEANHWCGHAELHPEQNDQDRERGRERTAGRPWLPQSCTDSPLHEPGGHGPKHHGHVIGQPFPKPHKNEERKKRRWESVALRHFAQPPLNYCQKDSLTAHAGLLKIERTNKITCLKRFIRISSAAIKRLSWTLIEGIIVVYLKREALPQPNNSDTYCTMPIQFVLFTLICQ